ncbi:MAG: DUF6249 domain-containing protein [Lepagella sp.]
MDGNISEVLITLLVCVILPVGIVFIINYRKINKDNQRAKILTKMIESANDIDGEKLAGLLEDEKEKKQALKTPEEQRISRLLKGCIFTLIGLGLSLLVFFAEAQKNFLVIGSISAAIGISFLIVYFVTGKSVKRESTLSDYDNTPEA